MEHINENIKELITLSGLSTSKFAVSTGNQPRTFHNILTGKYKPSFDVLYSIGINIPKLFHNRELNYRWLILNEGEIFTGNKPKGKNTETELTETERERLNKTIDTLLREIEEKRERIERIEKFHAIETADLEKIILQKRKEIERLKGDSEGV